MEKLISVLMVDDEAQFRETTSRILRKHGYATTMAADGEEAVAKVTDFPFDVVVLDVQMDGLSGIETLKRIKQLRPETCVIMLTGHGTIEGARESLKKGATDYLNKPCDISLLAQKIKAGVMVKQPEKEQKERLARDIMILIDNYTSVTADATVRDAIKAVMKSMDGYISTSRLVYTVHRSVLVFNHDRILVGILSVRTLLESLMPSHLAEAKQSMADSTRYSHMFWSGLFTSQARNLSGRPVSEIMDTGFVRVDKDANLMEVVDLMARNRTRRVVVMDQQRVLGVVREQELFYELANIIL